MLIYIIRHGETNLNAQGRLQGRYDEPLNENGIKLAEVTGEALKGVPFDLLFTSPLKRAKKTGEVIIAPSAKLHHSNPEEILVDDFMEMGFGEWEGKGTRTWNYELPVPYEVFNRFFTDPFAFEPESGGETFRDVVERTDTALQNIIHNPEYEDKTLLIATHGCAMRGMLNRYYEDKNDFWQGRTPYNCAVNVILARKGESQLVVRDRIYYDKSLLVDHYKISK